MKLTAKPGKGEKIHLSLDGEYIATVNADYWFTCGIKSGAEITPEQLDELLSESAYLPGLQGPVYFDYGRNTTFGKHCDVNFGLTCLDVCPVTIGDNVLIGPNVTIATPMHPLVPEERNVREREDGSLYNLEYAKPITIEQNCWLAANVVVCGGVTIGEGSVIGAGSVVTRDIPPHSIAAGNPCRVIRQVTDEDRMER